MLGRVDAWDDAELEAALGNSLGAGSDAAAHDGSDVKEDGLADDMFEDQLNWERYQQEKDMEDDRTQPSSPEYDFEAEEPVPEDPDKQQEPVVDAAMLDAIQAALVHRLLSEGLISRQEVEHPTFMKPTSKASGPSMPGDSCPHRAKAKLPQPLKMQPPVPPPPKAKLPMPPPPPRGAPPLPPPPGRPRLVPPPRVTGRAGPFWEGRYYVSCLLFSVVLVWDVSFHYISCSSNSNFYKNLSM